jgi:hypothetical protein
MGLEQCPHRNRAAKGDAVVPVGPPPGKNRIVPDKCPCGVTSRPNDGAFTLPVNRGFSVCRGG